MSDVVIICARYRSSLKTMTLATKHDDPLQNKFGPASLIFLDADLEQRYEDHLKREQVEQVNTTRLFTVLFTIVQSSCYTSFMGFTADLPIEIWHLNPKQLLILTVCVLAAINLTFFVITYTKLYFSDPLWMKVWYSTFNGLAMFGSCVAVQLGTGDQESKNILHTCTTFCFFMYYIYFTSYFSLPASYIMPTIICLIVGQAVVIVVPDNDWGYILFQLNRRVAFLLFTRYGCALWESVSRTEFVTLVNIHKEEIQIQQENHYIETLLKVLLPCHMVQQVFQNQQCGHSRIISQDVTQATVMFVKIVGFDEMNLTPETELALLVQILTVLDEYSEKHTNVCKIKTVGYSVLYVSGIDTPNDSNDTVEWALEVLQLVKEFNEHSGTAFRPRIGIAVGPLVAGVIGSKRPKFDIWGDTVNTASRMETSGVDNAIQITESTKDHLSGNYEMTTRGTIFIKGKGSMNTYLLSSPSEQSIVVDITNVLERKCRRASFSVFFNNRPHADEEDITVTTSSKELLGLIDCTKVQFKDPDVEAEFDAYYHSRARKSILLSRVMQLINLGGVIIVLHFGYLVSSLTLEGCLLIWIAMFLGLLIAFTPLHVRVWEVYVQYFAFVTQCVWAVMTYTGMLPFTTSETVLFVVSHLCTFHYFQRYWPAFVQSLQGLVIFTVIIWNQGEAVLPSLCILYLLTFFVIAVHYTTEYHQLQCFYLYGIQKKHADDIATQKDISQNLLETMLPKFIIERLKENEDTFVSLPPAGGQATTLVLDIVDFTKLCSQLPASKIVHILNIVFATFDDLCATYRVTKVKTIGDAAIAVSNLEEKQEDHAQRVIDLGMEMINKVKNFNAQNQLGVTLSLRIGISTGGLYAVVIRTKSFSFDVWGDSLDIAEQCQVVGRPGCVTISESALQLVKDVYHVKEGSTVVHKGKHIRSYQVKDKISATNSSK